MRRVGVARARRAARRDGRRDVTVARDITSWRDASASSRCASRCASRARSRRATSTTVDAFAERVLQQETRDAVVVAFTMARCPHCAALKPHWEALRDEFAVRKRTVDVLEIDCGEAREVCAWQRATRFPTIKYYVPGDGDELGREYGTSRAATYDALATFVEHYLERARD